MFASRNTNLYGTLDNDDFVDYWGGLYNTISYVNGGNSPEFNILSYANRNNAQSVSLEQFINNELTTRYLNPSYVKAMMNSASSQYSNSRYLTKFFSNFYKFQQVAPEQLTQTEWNQLADM
jgi:cobaltochelatase CobN